MGARHPRSETVRRSGFTLLELLIAATLTLMMMGAVVTIFGVVSNTVNESRATMEMTERLRSTAMLLQEDLAGITVPMVPPREPDKGEGYFEYIEGPIGPVAPLNQAFGTSTSATKYQPAINKEGITADSKGNPLYLADCTVGDTDDILMFTTRRKGEPFQGRAYVIDKTDNTRKNVIAKSEVAEVAWFMRGRTLYRRVLLVAPNIPIRETGSASASRCDYAKGFYAKSDISVHLINQAGTLVAPNSLGDLTKRENRFAHCMNYFSFDYFPFDVRRWCQMGLPTLLECSSKSWGVGTVRSHLVDGATYGVSAATNLENNKLVEPLCAAQDYWSVNPYDRFTNPYNLLPNRTLVPGTSTNKYSGSRYTEDVVLNNVIGFDVKVWDPGAPIVAAGAGATSVLSTVALLPGDPGYIAALTKVTLPTSNASTKNYPLAFGAYVDLNYMCRLGPRKQ